MSLKERFDKHPKSKYWSDRNEINPCEVSLNSHKKFWFDCNECGHQFECSCLSINYRNSWCPYCAHKLLCNDDKCEKCFNNSFASQEKSKYWSDDNIFKPRQVFKATDRKIFKFNCDKCDHKLELVLKKITLSNRWCKFCAHQELCENNNCKQCFNNSFAYIERSKYLYDKLINPRLLFKSTNKKFKFNCDICINTFDCQLSDITKGVWCPYCVNKTEKKFYDEMINHHPKLKRQFKVDWCKNINHLPFDFAIEEYKIIIEIDGPQHFQQISDWQSPQETRKRDLYKMKCAYENGYSIIRILQEDVFHNRFDWINELNDAITKITNDDVVQNIYICKNGEYKDFDQLL